MARIAMYAILVVAATCLLFDVSTSNPGGNVDCTNKLEVSAELLLGAESNSLNPFEYISQCLNTKLEILDEWEEEEAQLILQYINNTSNLKDETKILKIFRIQRAGEDERYKKSGVGNPWMLWHGTNAVNLPSIFQSGLKVAPARGVSVGSGHSFGKGIYFADTFTKSSHYCHGNGTGPKYMFLCEVALGKIQHVKLPQSEIKPEKPLAPAFHSLKTVDSKYEPNPASTILWKGRNVPIGRPVKNVLPEGEQYGLDYNDFAVFNENQVKLRYLIQFEDKYKPRIMGKRSLEFAHPTIV